MYSKNRSCTLKNLKMTHLMEQIAVAETQIDTIGRWGVEHVGIQVCWQ
jgi:hypothetical protein